MQKFLKIFKTKMKSQLETKPKQEIKSFLNNFENLLKQQKEKFWKQTKIDLVEDNYDQFAVYVMREMYYDKIFRCQPFEYVMEQQFNTIEEIKDSLIVKNGSELNKEDHKDALLLTNEHIDFIIKLLEKVATKLSKSSRPNKLTTLRKDISNIIENIRDNKKTEDIEKEIIEADKELNNKIISILEDLDIVKIDRTTLAKTVHYSESPIKKFSDANENEGLKDILKDKFKQNAE